MTTIAIELRVEMRCAGCDALSVVPGLVDEVRCAGCGKTARVDLARWSQGLEEPIRRSLEEDHGQTWRWHSDHPGADVALRFEFKRWPPVCPSCRAAIDADALGAGDLACGCGASIAVRELPREIEALGLPRPAWLVGEGAPAVGVVPRRVTSGAWLDSIWIVARRSRGTGMLSRDHARALHGVAFDRSGELVVLFHEDKQGVLAGLDADDELRWQARVHVDKHAYLLACPGADEIAIVDPKSNCLHVHGSRDGALLRTLQGPAPAHEDRHAHHFRRREPQTIDVYDRDLVGLGIGPEGTIAIARNWYDDLGKSLRRFDRDGRPLAPWRRRPGFLKRMFGPEDPPSWRDLTDRPLELQGWTDRFAVARNGALLACGKEGEEAWLQRWHADGTRIGAVRLPTWVRGVRAMGGDAQGTPVLLVERGTVDDYQTVVAALHGTTLDVIAGPFAGNESLLDVHDDGRIVIAGRGDSMRVLAPDGRVLWRNVATVREDRKRETRG